MASCDPRERSSSSELAEMLGVRHRELVKDRDFLDYSKSDFRLMVEKHPHKVAPFTLPSRAKNFVSRFVCSL